MKTRKSAGGEGRAKSGANQPILLPVDARLRHLTPEELRVVIAIVEKTADQSWETVADGLGLSRRGLFGIRGSRRIQEAVYLVSREFLRSDIAGVLAALSQKARSGDTAAMRLFFELLEQYDTQERRTYLGEDPFADLRRKLGDGPPED